ncbi:cytochrome c oxidase assembly protein COX16-domain-containing protein [Cantharellus anzutake]|uniref:cytochrome c oxidase assembly protein COX16-domain-containing protein n=1 Tax=Cantharellus anzutake TaxID=1750568 RepID=UPI001908E856|nr:cytochrome c oxidase assembly protein COX16-domain-containing protein [Cantharellus anzutake]KAF8329725.1 cytochrome c oxidase assembly protein COX16-domain-containing protein [Cantharellus anzutake]
MSFEPKPLVPRSSAAQTWNRGFRKNPLVFGIPFVLTLVIASFGLSTLTRTRYDLHDNKVKEVSKEEEIRLKKDRRKLDIREEYFRLQADGGKHAARDDWEQVRVPRPEGTPEWGVPPSSTR